MRVRVFWREMLSSRHADRRRSETLTFTHYRKEARSPGRRNHSLAVYLPTKSSIKYF